MNKRILSMLLALCMVLVALPVFALAVVAADGEEATVNISFYLPDGTEVCKRTIPVGVADDILPTGQEIANALAIYNAKEGIQGKYELTAEEILGFYDVSARNTITAAGAYNGTLINKDMAFYAFTAKSVFRPDNNWPLFSWEASFNGFCGGWSAGYYNKDSHKITAYTLFDAPNNILNAGDTWTQGGLYLGNDPHMVTCADNSVTLVWKAIVPGTVNVDFAYLGFPSGNYPPPSGGKADVAVAIAKNGTIVWPKAAAGKTIAETWATAGSGTDNTWFYNQLEGKTGDMTAAYQEYCTTNEDFAAGINVMPGDDIQIVLKKAAAAGATAYPAVTYTEMTGGVDAEAAGIVTAFATKYASTFDASTNYPAYPVETANGKEVTFRGNWDFVRYEKAAWGDATRAVVNKLANVSGGSTSDAFITADGTGAWGTAVGVRVPSGNAGWGDTGALSSTPAYTVGYRYTAEYTGLANIVLTDYYIGATTYNPKDAVLGIFVNGQMVWPAAGDYYADASKWATVTTTKKTAENLPTNLLITKGDMVELLVGAPNGYVRGATIMPVSVNYTELYHDPQISAVGTPNESGTYDLMLTVNPGGMDEVKVEAADNKSGTFGNYTELTENNGVYKLVCEQFDLESYTVTFRVTMGLQGKTTFPQYISYTIPSRYAPLIHTGFGLQENTPVLVGGIANFRGNWDFVLYSAASEIGTSAGRSAKYFYSTGGSFAFSDNKSYNYGDANFTAAVNYGEHTEWGGMTYGAYARNGSAVSYRYIAEGSGLADITLDKLGHVSSPWTSDVSWGIFINGEKIWPTADTAIDGLTFVDGWLRHTTAADVRENLLTADQLAAVNAQLKNIYLREGDALEFVCYAHGTCDQWANTGNVCYASVDYTAWEEAELPTVDTVSAVMGTDFGFVLNCTNNNPQVAELLATATIGDRALTVTVNGNKISITGIRATEMTDTITYRVYARSTNGTVATSRLVKEATTTYADLLAGYLVEGTDVKVKDMAIATLKYGAAAQTRFLYRPDDLATRVLGEGDTLSFTAPSAADEYAQTSAATNYRFAGASFLLNEKIQLKLFIDLQAGQDALNGTLYLEIAEGNGAFVRSDAKISQRATADPSNAHLKAILDLNPTANATVYRFRLVNEAGVAVSTELTYSVAAYAHSAVEDKALTDAILAFGQAARNYNA